MSFYADSSFLVSCYIRDANTATATVWLSRTGAPLLFTSLHALEARNAFELGVFRRLFSTADAAVAWSTVESDLRAARLIKTSVKWPLAFRVAAHLSESHSTVTGSRSLDILHVATAKSLRATDFVSFDARQRVLAAAAGLKVSP